MAPLLQVPVLAQEKEALVLALEKEALVLALAQEVPALAPVQEEVENRTVINIYLVIKGTKSLI